MAQDGLKAVLTCHKFAESVKEITKDGTKETRQLVLKGDFHLFVEGQRSPMKLPVKLEFKDEPNIVQLIQTALNVEDTGEMCLLTVHSNRQQRLEKYIADLDKRKKKQELKFGEPSEEEPDQQIKCAECKYDSDGILVKKCKHHRVQEAEEKAGADAAAALRGKKSKLSAEEE